MRHRCYGFVVVVVLILLQLCAWIEIYALQHIAKMIKQSELFWLRQIDLTRMNDVLSQIENSLRINKPLCMVTSLSADTVIKKSLSWWNMYGCSGKFSEIQYYYAVEWLGNDSCSAIQYSHDVQPAVVSYYRITLLAFPASIKNTKLYVQTTVAFLSDEISACQEKFHVVKLGRQMWREI